MRVESSTHAGLVFDHQHGLRRSREGCGDHGAESRYGDVTARPRPVDLECRPLAGFAVHPDVALALLDDAVGRRQAKACALSGFLGREERLEQVALGLLGHSATRIGDGEHHIAPLHDRLLVEGGVLELDVRGFDRHAPTTRHGISRVDHEVHHDLFQLAAIRERQGQPGRQSQRDLDVLADQPAEHACHVRDQPVHIERHAVAALVDG